MDPPPAIESAPPPVIDSVSKDKEKYAQKALNISNEAQITIIAPNQDTDVHSLNTSGQISSLQKSLRAVFDNENP